MIGKLGIYDKVLQGQPANQAGPLTFNVWGYNDSGGSPVWKYRLQPYVDYGAGGNIKIDWGDGGISDYTSGSSNRVIQHSYTGPGPYVVKILEFNSSAGVYGSKMIISSEDTADQDPLNSPPIDVKASIELLSWNNMVLNGCDSFFQFLNSDYKNSGGTTETYPSGRYKNNYPCEFTYSATDSPYLRPDSNLYATYWLSDFTNPNTSLLNNFDMTNAKSLNSHLANTNFNGDISLWNIPNVINLKSTFDGADDFNQPLNSWDTSSVETMLNIFRLASSFNQPLNSWDTSNVTSMVGMFNSAINFNQDISSWCVTNITSEPFNFSSLAPLTTPNKPVWGTCPP